MCKDFYIAMGSKNAADAEKKRIRELIEKNKETIRANSEKCDSITKQISHLHNKEGLELDSIKHERRRLENLLSQKQKERSEIKQGHASENKDIYSQLEDIRKQIEELRKQKEKVSDELKSISGNLTTFEIELVDDIVSAVMGTKGSNINEIRKSTNADIKVDTVSGLIIIRGDSASAQDAKKKIEELIVSPGENRIWRVNKR